MLKQTTITCQWCKKKVSAVEVTEDIKGRHYHHFETKHDCDKKPDFGNTQELNKLFKK